MDSNKSNTGEIQDSKWYKLPLRDWAIIVGFIAYYINSAGANASYASKMETIVKEISDMKLIFKEMQNEQKANYRYLDERTNKTATELEVVKQRLETLERTVR